MKKNKISKNWINRQRRDIYVRQSKIEGYRSRAVYKLKEIDEKFKILNQTRSVVDLGAAPGSWSQYLSKKIKNGKILSIDLLKFEPIKNTHQIVGDFTDGIRLMVKNIEVVRLEEPEDIFPSYEKALMREDRRNTILVEYGDYYNEK